jgi:hypothetical protein
MNKQLILFYFIFIFLIGTSFRGNAQIIEATSPVYNFSIKKTKTELKDIKPPVIEVVYPVLASTRGFKPVVEDKIITILGRVSDESGIYEVSVNGNEAAVDAEGNFSHEVLLVVGENLITVQAVDGKLNKQTLELVVVRKSENAIVSPTQDIEPEELIKAKGKYYALIIGVNDYQSEEITDLDRPISDAQDFYSTLTQKYTFDKENTYFLKNPTREQIIKQLDYFADKLNTEDNLVIFYAGHGYWDEKRSTGYWLPADATRSSTAQWLRNSTIQEYIQDIKTKHTLLIADACFSGSIFKTRKAFEDAPDAINKLYELPSRKAMTSGTLTEVPDNSVFMEFFLKRLNQNEEKYLSSLQLFTAFRMAVMNNSTSTPQYGTIQNAGDEGGDFIFIRRN